MFSSVSASDLIAYGGIIVVVVCVVAGGSYAKATDHLSARRHKQLLAVASGLILLVLAILGVRLTTGGDGGEHLARQVGYLQARNEDTQASLQAQRASDQLAAKAIAAGREAEEWTERYPNCIQFSPDAFNLDKYPLITRECRAPVEEACESIKARGGHPPPPCDQLQAKPPAPRAFAEPVRTASKPVVHASSDFGHCATQAAIAEPQSDRCRQTPPFDTAAAQLADRCRVRAQLHQYDDQCPATFQFKPQTVAEHCNAKSASAGNEIDPTCYLYREGRIAGSDIYAGQ